MNPAELTARYGSPLYVYEAAAVHRAFHSFQKAFPYSALDIHYAIVCNKNPYLVRMLHGLGAGIHANTPGDAHAALTAGVPADRIVYSGTNLNSEDFDFLIGHRVRMNLDSLDQVGQLLERPGTPATFGLRFLIDDATRQNRIGVTADEVAAALKLAQAAGVRLAGLHLYAGTNTCQAERFFQCFDRMLSASDLLPDLEYLDLGGGYGVSYSPRQPDLDLRTLGQEITTRMETLSRRRGRPIQLLIEPGRALVAESGTLLTTVVTVKERGGRRYVGVDTTVGNIVVESVYHPYHRIEAVSPRGPDLEIPTDICGNTTHSRDYLGKARKLPELRAGDLLALRDVGAYGYAMSSHFLNRPRPAEVVIDGPTTHLTTRRETMVDLMANHILS